MAFALRAPGAFAGPATRPAGPRRGSVQVVCGIKEVRPGGECGAGGVAG
jgi:hypothetical protein